MSLWRLRSHPPRLIGWTHWPCLWGASNARYITIAPPFSAIREAELPFPSRDLEGPPPFEPTSASSQRSPETSQFPVQRYVMWTDRQHTWRAANTNPYNTGIIGSLIRRNACLQRRGSPPRSPRKRTFRLRPFPVIQNCVLAPSSGNRLATSSKCSLSMKPPSRSYRYNVTGERCWFAQATAS